MACELYLSNAVIENKNDLEYLAGESWAQAHVELPWSQVGLS